MRCACAAAWKLLFFGWLVTAGSARVASAADQSAKPLKGLLITGGCCHDYDRQKEIITEGISQRANIVWDTIHEGDPKDRTHQISIYAKPDWSKGYDVVVHNECFGAVEDVAFVERIVRGHTETGVACVVVHCSMHTYRAAPTDEWRKLVGVTSRRHERGKRKLDVVNAAQDHPIMAGFPEKWQTPNGELYIIENIWPNTTPLATAFSPETKSNQLCIWTNTYGKARVFGTTLGHHNETMVADEWLDTVARGLLWSCGKLGDDGKPLAGYAGTGKGLLSFQKKIAEGGEPTPAN
ncbi:MAG: ThuA domain-containing protein [Planctomycetales bacterium]|nr:ThuA domain-containing protein [Planctomycetales bacterium]